jgi:hypothetical protein
MVSLCGIQEVYSVYYNIKYEICSIGADCCRIILGLVKGYNG